MSFELFFNISKDGNFWTYADESSTTFIIIIIQLFQLFLNAELCFVDWSTYEEAHEEPVLSISA